MSFMADRKSAPLTQQFDTSLSLSSISHHLGINTPMCLSFFEPTRVTGFGKLSEPIAGEFS